MLRFNRKACRKPGIHTAGDVVDVTVSQIDQRFCRNVAAMAGLAIDDDVVLKLCAELTMACFHFTEIDVEVGSRNEALHMFFRGSHIDQHKSLLGRRGNFGQSSPQLLNGQ